MSHRFSNYVMALIAAQVLDVALLAAPFDYRSSQHGNYSGMDAFFGVSAGEWSEAEAMARWPNLTRIDLPRLDNWARYELGGMFSPASRTSVWPQKRASLTRKCHIIFNVLPDDWLTDPKPATKWLLAKKWARHVPSLPLALRTLAFRAADVNIAVHFRTGDMTPTTEAWHVEVLARTVLPALADAVAEGTRLVVHIFLQVGARAGEEEGALFTIVRPHRCPSPPPTTTTHHHRRHHHPCTTLLCRRMTKTTACTPPSPRCCATLAASRMPSSSTPVAT